MKKLFNFIFLLLLFSSSLRAQQLYFEAGKGLTSFDYRNSQGLRLDNLHATPQSRMAIGFRQILFGKKTNGTFGLGYAGYGAIGSSDGSGTLEWQLNYLQLKLGLDYDVFTIEGFTFYVKGASSISYLIQGAQTIDNQVFDAKKTKDLNKPTFNLGTGLGFSYRFSRTLAIYSHFISTKSLTNKTNSKESVGHEKLSMASNSMIIGVLVNIISPSRQKFR